MKYTNYTKSQQYAIVSILIRIMEADGVIDPNEVKLLNATFIDFNITEQELEIISSYDFNQCRSILSSIDKDDIKKVKSLFLEMAKCDGNADPRELAIINLLCK